MKQTVAVMAIIVALLLMVSGYIVAQHAETSAELRRRCSWEKSRWKYKRQSGKSSCLRTGQRN